jgi:predicted permease
VRIWPWTARRDREIDAEIEAHLRMAVDDRVDRGEERDAAELAARREFGNRTLIAEIVRETWGWTSIERLAQDLRYALRMMRRSPGFTAIAVSCLSVAIGANAAIFSLLDPVLLRTLPVRDPDRLVEFVSVYPGEGKHPIGVTRSRYELFRDRNHAFSDLIGFAPARFLVSGEGIEQEQADGLYATGNVFTAFGLRPVIGRLFTPEDDRPDANGVVAVVSWRYWDTRLNFDPAILGRRISLNGIPVSIVGVLPRAFTGVQVGSNEDVWVPERMASIVERTAPQTNAPVRLALLGRLRPGVSIEQARAEVAVLNDLRSDAASQSSAAPVTRQLQLDLEPAAGGFSLLRDYLETPLVVLMTVVALLLLIACTNVASMLLAKATARRREMAVRVSLGAGRLRLVRQMLTEALLLSAIASALGVLFAFFGAHALARVLISGRAMIGHALTVPVHMDARVLLFTTAITILTGVLFGLAPAWNAFATAPNAVLREAGASSGTRSRRSFGRVLVAAQIALSLVLLTGAVLFVRHLAQLRGTNLGFERQSVLLVALDPRGSGLGRQQLTEAYRELLRRFDAIPGVRSATVCAVTPSSGAGASHLVTVEGFREDMTSRLFVSLNWVGPKYFETLRTPLLAGRDFTFDDEIHPRVAIVNESMARYYFQGRSPIGGRVRLDGDPKPYEIVGVAADAKYGELRAPAPRTMYMNAFQEGRVGSQFALRTSLPPARVAGAARQVVQDTLKPVRIASVSTLADEVDAALVPERLMASLSGLIGGIGGALAALGLYGLLAYTVARRTNEIGVRIALGAMPRDVALMVLKGAVGLVGLGLLAGVPCAIIGRQIASSLVPGLPQGSALPMAMAAASMLAVALLAAYVPARRAARIDPLAALRHE